MSLIIRQIIPAAACAAALIASVPTPTSAAAPAPASAPRALPVLRAALIMPDAPTKVTTVLSYSDGVALVGARNTPVLTDLTVVRDAGDADSGVLRQAMLGSARLGHGVALTLTPAGSTQPEIKITLGDVTVTGDTITGADGTRPQEQVTFHFRLFAHEVFTPIGRGTYFDTKSCWSGALARQQCPTPVV